MTIPAARLEELDGQLRALVRARLNGHDPPPPRPVVLTDAEVMALARRRRRRVP